MENHLPSNSLFWGFKILVLGSVGGGPDSHFQAPHRSLQLSFCHRLGSHLSKLWGLNLPKKGRYPKQDSCQLGSRYVKILWDTSHTLRQRRRLVVTLGMLTFSQVLNISPPKIHEEMPKLAKRRDSRSARRCKHSWRTQRVHERQQAYLGKIKIKNKKKNKYVLVLAPVFECHVREMESFIFGLQSMSKSFYYAFQWSSLWE